MGPPWPSFVLRHANPWIWRRRNNTDDKQSKGILAVEARERETLGRVSALVAPEDLCVALREMEEGDW